MKPTTYLYKYLIFLIIGQILLGCKKYVEIDPPKSQLVTNNVFKNSSTATAAVTSIYSQMFNDNYPYLIPLYTGMSSDELKSYSSYAPFLQLYSNSLTSSNGAYVSIWNSAYNYIYQANQAIEGLQEASDVPNIVKTQLTGEAKFIRAFWHFYLVNLFSDIPLATTTVYKVNAFASRMPSDQVYQQIITDLKDAQVLLSDIYVDATDSLATTDRVRPTRSVATALLARVFLYNKDWVNAEDQSTAIINNKALYDTVPLKSVFLRNSKEAIWQLLPVNPGYNTLEGNYFILTGAPSTGSGTQTSSLSNQLMNAFELNDKRKTSWTASVSAGTNTYYYPYKYKVSLGSNLTEYSMVFRLAEQYLIRAEARAQQNKLADAQSDLNLIRTRAGLNATTANDKPSLLNAILHERQVELFTEWGHRWFDLRRGNAVDSNMRIVTPLKGGTWETTDQLYPIPQSERNKDPNLTQNAGY